MTLNEVLAAIEKRDFEQKLQEGPRRGDRIRKTDGDYSFEGEVMRVFRKRSGARRILVENDDGLLLVMSHKQNIEVIKRAEREDEYRLEDYEDALYRLASWAEAYPLDIFPEPDFRKAAKLLEAGGMTLDAISASNMRRVVKGIERIVKEAIHGKAGAAVPEADQGPA